MISFQIFLKNNFIYSKIKIKHNYTDLHSTDKIKTKTSSGKIKTKTSSGKVKTKSQRYY